METARSPASGKLLGIARREKTRDPMETVAEVLVTKESGVDGLQVVSVKWWKSSKHRDPGVEQLINRKLLLSRFRLFTVCD